MQSYDARMRVYRNMVSNGPKPSGKSESSNSRFRTWRNWEKVMSCAGSSVPVNNRRIS